MNIFRNSKLASSMAIIFLFVSCNQYESEEPEIVPHNKFHRLLTDIEIEEICQNHNKVLNELFEVNLKNKSDISDRVMELYEDTGLTKENLDSYINVVDKMNMSYLLTLIDEIEDDFVDGALLKEKLKELKSLSVSKDLQQHAKKTKKELRGIDLDLYLVICKVYQHSSDFWSKKYPLASKQSLSGWREADGISAGIGFLTMAATFAAISAVGIATGGTGVIPTITIVASLLRIGTSSALASIYAAIK